MPQVFSVKEGDITIKCGLAGFRRCPLLSWTPYMTGARPKACLSVNADSPIKRLFIKHQRPSGGYNTSEIQDVAVPLRYFLDADVLKEPGSHSYAMRVEMASGVTHESIFLMTGKVFQRDDVVRVLVTTVGALIVGGLITHLISCLLN